MNSSVSELVLQALGNQSAQAVARAPWPELRQELNLYPASSMRNGQPAWTLHDPVRNLYFQLDWMSFEVLANWSLGDAAAIATAIREQTTLTPSVKSVENVGKFLKDNQLVQALGADNSAEMAGARARMRKKWWQSLLHNYLFFRIPLLRPDAALARMLPKIALFFDRRFFLLTLLAFCIAIVLVYRQWDVFKGTLVTNFTVSGGIAWAVVLVLVKLFHELGHGLTAKRFGCNVPTMGLAFLVLFPMPYTDTNEAWKLKSRRQRLLIGSAGVITELVIAVWATLAWAFLPDGPLRHAAFLLSTTTWVSTVVVNCSPFLRFDGYFVLSDFLEMPNLHARAFALARWKLRECLFDLGMPPPERFPRRLHVGLLLFAYLVWIYRLVVFIGIAVLVYAFFIKLVGLLLFVVEIAWFIMMPIQSEIKVWYANRALIRKRARSWLSASIVMLLVLLAFVPLPALVRTSGLLHPGEGFAIHAREGSQLEALHVADGARLKAGTPLLRMSSEGIDRNLQAAQSRIVRFDSEISLSSFDPEQRARLQVREGQLQTADTTRRGLELQKSEYQPVASVDGRFRLADPDLKPGTWMSRNEQIGTVISDVGWYVECYVSEDVVHRVAVGDAARFYPDGRAGTVLSLRVAAIDRDATHILEAGVLAAQFGGSVEVREADGKLVPEKASYRVRLEALEGPPRYADQTWRGTVVVNASYESIAARFGRAALSLIWREAGL